MSTPILLLLLLLLLPLATANTPAPCPRTISLSGFGSVTSPPDTAVISTGVVTLATTAQAALSQNNRLTRALFSTLSDFDIPSRDIRTIAFSVSPRFQRSENPNSDTRRIIGYTVRNTLSVTVRDISQLGEVLDALVRAGSNAISDVRFSIANDVELADRARRLAVRDAVRKATVLAGEVGASVGKVMEIREGGARGLPRNARSTVALESGVQVAPGVLEIDETVQVVFELVGGGASD